MTSYPSTCIGYNQNLSAHLTLPYNWIDCADPEICQEYIHLTDTAENLNHYPIEWVETLIGNCFITETEIHFYNSAGEKHNPHGPAVIKSNATLQWYLNGKLHRDGGPAVEHADGSQEWYSNDAIHREDGPAMIRADGTKEWCLNSERHREDGPAIIWASGKKEWWIDGFRKPDPEN